jgi:arylsulfatase A-like enzyme
LALACAACRRGGIEEGAEELLARAAALRERAAGFDERAVLEALAPSPLNGPVVRFDERAERAEASGRPIALPDVPGFGFEFDGGDPVGFRLAHPEHRVEGGVLHIGAAARVPLGTEPLDLDPTQYAEIEVRIRLARGASFELAWARAFGSPGRLRIDAADDGEFHVYRIDARTALRRRVPPGERIRHLVLTPSNRSDDVVEVDYLRFVPKGRRYAARVFGRAYESRGDELRSVLFSGSPQRLAFPVEVPADAPRLSFGMGVLEAGDPVRFRVAVVSEAGERELASLRVDDPTRWRDAELDLAAWAGRHVEIAFDVESARGNIAFWSNPVLFGAPPERFNVIVLLEDAQRADHLSAYGHSRPTSPTKDRLAERGVLFEYAFSQAPTTRPSCPSLMTGLYPSATGVWTHEQMLDERYLTLAEVLRSQGFATASFVQNSNAGRSAGLHQGFDHLFERPATDGHEGVYAGPVARWLEHHGSRNFLLYLHVIDPHGAYDPPKPWDAWYRELGAEGTPVRSVRSLDPGYVARATLEGRRALYDGEIRHNDAWLEKLVERLERTGWLEHTLWVFVSDHGEHFGEHAFGRELLDGHRAPGYVQALRVPLILVRPGLLPGGRRIEAPVQLVDVVPTILELAGVDTRGMLLQGESLLPLIEGRGEDRWRRRIAVSEEPDAWHGRDDRRISASAFTDRWHLLSSLLGPQPLLFDYRADPQEQSPLAGRERERQVLGRALVELKQANVAIWRQMTREADGAIEYEAEALEQLRELGYIE